MSSYKKRKVKRSKSLYRRRKSTARKVLEVMAMLLVVGGLCFVGFAAGRPLINFFFGEKPINPNGDGDGDLYAAPTGNDVPAPDNSAEIVARPTDNLPIDDSVSDFSSYNAIFAPSSVLDNQTSLAAYIRQIRENGFNAVILEMKDATGNLAYASSYPPLANTDIIRENSLSATQIYAAFEGTGVMPIAKINTAADHLGSAIPDVAYAGWLDARREDGGRPWANPFLQGTRDYNSFLVGELAEAGFTEIVLANLIFPHFRGIDFSIIADEYTNPVSRYAGLVGLWDAVYGNKGAARLSIEMNLKDVVESHSGYSDTAEILRGRKDLRDTSLLLVYNKDDYGAELITGENSTVILPPDTAAAIALLYRQAEILLQQDFAIIPGLVTAGLSDAETADALKTFAELNFDSFVIR
ncbi:MAG: putative glycoside hydrolase [Oscillospiraceae bacterium]|nr:putative glycoside hydrolase [Oscillospiraceae bacterium]